LGDNHIRIKLDNCKTGRYGFLRKKAALFLEERGVKEEGGGSYLKTAKLV